MSESKYNPRKYAENHRVNQSAKRGMFLYADGTHEAFVVSHPPTTTDREIIGHAFTRDEEFWSGGVAGKGYRNGQSYIGLSGVLLPTMLQRMLYRIANPDQTSTI